MNDFIYLNAAKDTLYTVGIVKDGTVVASVYGSVTESGCVVYPNIDPNDSYFTARLDEDIQTLSQQHPTQFIQDVTVDGGTQTLAEWLDAQ